MRLLLPRLHVPKQQSNAASEDSVQPEDRLKRVLRLHWLMQRPFLAYLRNTHCPTRTHTKLRNTYISLLKERDLSIRQLCRLTGISFGVIQKLYLNIYPVVKDRGCMECAEFCSCNMLVDDLALEMGIPHSKIQCSAYQPYFGQSAKRTS